MKKLFLIVGIITGLCWACDDRDDNLLGPNIRIQNLSQQNFQRVAIRSDSIFFDDIAADGFSEYLELDVAYHQDTLTVATDSTQLTFIPDSIGNPLPNGLYTYQLNITETGALELTFKLD